MVKTWKGLGKNQEIKSIVSNEPQKGGNHDDEGSRGR